MQVNEELIRQLHGKAWGKRWPTRKGHVTVAADVDAPLPDDVVLDDVLGLDYECLLDVHTVGEALGVRPLPPSTLVVVREYKYIWAALTDHMELFFEDAESNVLITGQAGSGGLQHLLTRTVR